MLKLAGNLKLPVDVVTQTIAILAKRRAGKSYTMRRLTEQLFNAGQQIVLVDPKGDRIPDWDEDWRYNVLTGEEWAGPRDEHPERSQHLDWVIVGGESGPGARPFDLAWARSIIQRCESAGVACFVKQLGARPHTGVFTTPDGQRVENSVYLQDRKGGDPSEWPEHLRVRQFPEARP
jgi:hypothetical protein